MSNYQLSVLDENFAEVPDYEEGQLAVSGTLLP